jgi:hypothetical protein
MVMGTEAFSNAGNNNCDRTNEREREREREKRESVAEKGIPEVLELWRRSLETTDRRTNGRTDGRDGRDGKKYSIFSKLVHF